MGSYMHNPVGYTTLHGHISRCESAVMLYVFVVSAFFTLSLSFQCTMDCSCMYVCMCMRPREVQISVFSVSVLCDI